VSKYMKSKVCFKCGTVDPEHEVSGYIRNCSECGGEASVLQVQEMVDLFNDLSLRGLLPIHLIENVIDTEYNVPELDFDDDVMRAEMDAYNDYIGGEGDEL
jgi:hypothetical protein